MVQMPAIPLLLIGKGFPKIHGMALRKSPKQRFIGIGMGIEIGTEYH
jgi:hypothetical protein